MIGSQEHGHAEVVTAIADALKGSIGADGGNAVTVILSPEMSNESLYAAKVFAAKVLKSSRVMAGSVKPAGVDDTVLRKADLHPNRKGCELMTLWRDDIRDELRKGGRVALLIQNDPADHDPQIASDLDRFGTVICLATNLTDTTAKASIVHPVTPHSECEGTFTNFQGRVQRFRRAMPARGEARTVTELLSLIAGRLGTEFGWASHGQIWKEMGSTYPEFAGITPSVLGDDGMLIRSLRSETGAKVEGD